MSIVILFGKAGCGKSFIGDYLKNHYHWLHFDADQLLIEVMREYIRLEKQIPVEFIDEYMEILKGKIRDFYQTRTTLIVISQAMYRNKNRLSLLQEFPQLRFVWVTANDNIRYERIKQRNNSVTVSYAEKISPLFESPTGFHYHQIENNGQSLELHRFFVQLAPVNA